MTFQRKSRRIHKSEYVSLINRLVKVTTHPRKTRRNVDHIVSSLEHPKNRHFVLSRHGLQKQPCRRTKAIKEWRAANANRLQTRRIT